MKTKNWSSQSHCIIYSVYCLCFNTSGSKSSKKVAHWSTSSSITKPMRTQSLSQQLMPVVLLMHVHIRCCTATGMNIFSATHAAKPLAMVAWNWTSASNAAGGKNCGANNFFGARNFFWASNGRSRAVISSFPAPFSSSPTLVRACQQNLFWPFRLFGISLVTHLTHSPLRPTSSKYSAQLVFWRKLFGSSRKGFGSMVQSENL